MWRKLELRTVVPSFTITNSDNVKYVKQCILIKQIPLGKLRWGRQYGFVLGLEEPLFECQHSVHVLNLFPS